MRFAWGSTGISASPPQGEAECFAQKHPRFQYAQKIMVRTVLLKLGVKGNEQGDTRMHYHVDEGLRLTIRLGRHVAQKIWDKCLLPGFAWIWCHQCVLCSAQHTRMLVIFRSSFFELLQSVAPSLPILGPKILAAIEPESIDELLDEQITVPVWVNTLNIVQAVERNVFPCQANLSMLFSGALKQLSMQAFREPETNFDYSLGFMN